jgi:hypothetical protein
VRTCFLSAAVLCSNIYRAKAHTDLQPAVTCNCLQKQYCAGLLQLSSAWSGIFVQAVVQAVVSAAILQGWDCVQCGSCKEQQAMSAQLSSAQLARPCQHTCAIQLSTAEYVNMRGSMCGAQPALACRYLCWGVGTVRRMTQAHGVASSHSPGQRTQPTSAHSTPSQLHMGIACVLQVDFLTAMSSSAGGCSMRNGTRRSMYPGEK